MSKTMFEETNRQKRQTPKSGLYWCTACDSNVIAHGQNCPGCGCKLKKTNKSFNKPRDYRRDDPLYDETTDLDNY